MGQAQLEIVITDQGSAPIGQPAPASITAASHAGANPDSSTQRAPTSSGESESDNHWREGVTVLARMFSGGGELVRVAETFEKAAEWMAAAAKAPEAANGQSIASASSGGKQVANAVTGAGEGTEAGEAAALGEGVAGAAEGASLGLTAMLGPIALATAAVVGLGYAAKKVGDALDSQAHDLAMYSGVLAEATARADIRNQMAKMDQADSLGPQLADFEDTYSRLQEDGTHALTAIEEVLVAIFQPLLESIEPQIRVLADILKIIADGVTALLEAATFHMPTAIKMLGKLMTDIEKLGEDMLGDGADALNDPLGDAMFAGIAGHFPAAAAGVNAGAGPNKKGAAAGAFMGGAVLGPVGAWIGGVIGAGVGGA